MNKDRIDELLSETLATGAIPPGATPVERAEIERLVEITATLQGVRATVDAEASAAMPTARARFERHIAAAAQPEPIAIKTARPRGGSWWGALVLNRAVLGAGSVAAIGIIAVLGVLLSQNAFQGVETASAQVLTPGDYVQVEGVVGEAKDGRVSVHSEFGDFTFELSADTSIVIGEASGDASSVKRGASVLIGGLVGKDRAVAANTVSVSTSVVVEPTKLKLVQLKGLRPNLVGKVTVLTISPDGTKGCVHIDTGDGQRFVVPVDGQSAEGLIQRFSTAIGAKVDVGAAVGSQPGTFRLQVQDAPPALPPVRPATTHPAGSLPVPTTAPGIANDPASLRFVDVRGVILGRVGNTFRVQALRGPVIVVELRRTSRILPGQSGLTVDAILTSETAVGHEITLSGGRDAATGHIIIDIAVLGLKRPIR